MKNLFVGNMSFQTTESDLRALFEPFGQITRIHIVNDRETGKARGFAFVEMSHTPPGTGRSSLIGTPAARTPLVALTVALSAPYSNFKETRCPLRSKSASGK